MKTKLPTKLITPPHTAYQLIVCNTNEEPTLTISLFISWGCNPQDINRKSIIAIIKKYITVVV